MAEYIARETAIAKCREIAACEWNHRASPVSWADAYEQFAEDIEALPSADVAPVRHARWVDNHCTACGMMPMGDEMWKHLDLEPPLFERFMDYCPSCGCRMDG